MLSDITISKSEKDVFIQDQNSPLFQFFLQTYEKEDITLTSDVNINDTTLNVSASHGITTGQYIIVYDDYRFHQFKVVNVATNTITINSAFDYAFLQASTTIIRGSVSMKVNGSVTPVVFKFTIPSQYTPKIDISKALIIISHTGSPDDGLFGDQTALTNGLFIRKDNGLHYNLGNYQSNQDFRYVGASIEYSSKAPAGIYGTNISFVLNGQENFGQVIRMSYLESDVLSATVRDDLTGLSSMRISVIGSYTSGEGN